MANLLTVPGGATGKRPGSQRYGGTSPAPIGTKRSSRAGVDASSRNLKSNAVRTNNVTKVNSNRSGAASNLFGM